MSVALTEPGRYFTREEYYRWCDEQKSGRYERVEGHVVRMASERAAHMRVKLAACLALRQAIIVAGVSCQALPDGAVVATGDNDFEPDALVNCGARMEDDAIQVPNPVVVVEVLSPGTRTVDTGLKLIGYFAVASIAHYLIVHPVKHQVIHHRRTDAGIRSRILTAGPIVLDPPGITVAVEDFYRE